MTHTIKKHQKYSFLFMIRIFVFVTLFSSLSQAIEPLVIHSQTDLKYLASHGEILKDPNHRYGYSDLRRGAYDHLFSPIDSNSISLGYTNDVVWLRFTLENRSSKAFDGMIELSIPWIEEIDVYLDSSTQEHYQLGNSLPYEQREIKSAGFFAPVSVQAGEKTTVYIRAWSQHSTILVPILYTSQSAFEKIIEETNFVGILIGGVLLILFYNFFIFISTKDINYLYYSFSLATLFLFMGVLYGFNSKLFWPSNPEYEYLGTISIPLSFFAALLFSRNFLTLKEVFPSLDRLAALLMWSFFLLAFLGVFKDAYTLVSLQTTILLGVVYSPFMITIGVMSVIKKVSGSGYFVFAWTLFLLAIEMISLMALGYLEYSDAIHHFFGIALLTKTVLLSFALAARINYLRDLSNSQKESLQNYTVDLEKEVRVRTEEILKLSQTKEVFVANMSHEIRTPLNGIIGIVDILLKDQTTSAKVKKRLEIMKHSSKMLSNIVDDILDFSALQSGKVRLFKKEFSMQKMLKYIENVLMPSIQEKNLEFIIELDEDLEDSLIGDEMRLTQVLSNLISNARKFTNEGSISLKVTTLQKDSENISIRIEVSDTGIGMSEEIQKELFTAFIQGDQSNTKEHKGTGLGLVISKKLVELMDGTIFVESQEGKGTSFFVDLSFTYTKSVIDQNKDHTVRVLQEAKKALLVEDEPTNQMVLEFHFKEIGFDIDIANNGFEAIEHVQNKDYDIVFMDIQMPIMDGLEATKRIREFNTTLPIVALSAGVLAENIDASSSAGVNDHISKPIVNKELNRVLDTFFTTKEHETLSKEGAEAIDGRSLVPEFTNLDVNIGLKYLYNNEETYLKLLQRFIHDYGNFVLENLEDDERKRKIHSLKGISANIGATKLHKIVVELDKTMNQDLIKEFEEKFSALINELKEKLPQSVSQEVDEKKQISQEDKIKLFSELYEAVSLMEPKKCEPILEEIVNFEFTQQEQESIEEIKASIFEYDFMKAMELFDSIECMKKG